jgi:FkbM family methyltransferase
MIFEARRARRKGWKKVPGLWAILRTPHQFEVVLLAQRFLAPHTIMKLVDVGANTGRWAQRFSTFIPCDYAGFEPDPRAYSELRKLRPPESIHNCCIGRERGTVRFLMSSETTYSSKYVYDDRLDGHSAVDAVDIQQRRLDEFDLGQDPLLVKIDVQGSEIEVIEGAAGVLDRALLVIVEAPLFEQTTGRNSFAAIVSRLSERGFHPCYFCRGGVSLSRNTIPIEHDVLFVNVRMVDAVACLR